MANHRKQLVALYDDNHSPHILYDLSILDVTERISKAKEFNNAQEVAAHLGVRATTIFNNRQAGKRIRGINKKLYAVRIKK